MAGDSTGAVQAALRSALVSTAAVTGIVGQRIYDRAEEGDQFPYITFGSTTVAPYDGTVLDGAEIFMLVHGWSDKGGHKTQAQDLQAAIHGALHNQTLTVTGHTFVNCRVQDSRIMMSGPKDRIAHVATRVRIVTQ